MPINRILNILDVNVGSYVTDWGNFQDQKQLLLASSNMFVSSISITVENTSGQFSPSSPLGLFSGQIVYGVPAEVIFDNLTVFTGFVVDVQENAATKTATIIIENVLTKPANLNVILSGNSFNPVSLVQSILETANITNINQNSFTSVAAQYASADAEVNCNFQATDQITVLSAVNSIAQLAGFTVYSYGTTLTCVPGIPNDSFKSIISGNMVKNWGEKNYSYENYANQVTFPVGSGTLTVNVTNPSLPIKNYSFSSSNVSVSGQSSAQYFANLFLERNKEIRTEINLDVDDSLFPDIQLGDIYAVSNPLWYQMNIPYEVLEVNRKPADFTIGLKMASMPWFTGIISGSAAIVPQAMPLENYIPLTSSGTSASGTSLFGGAVWFEGVSGTMVGYLDVSGNMFVPGFLEASDITISGTVTVTNIIFA